MNNFNDDNQNLFNSPFFLHNNMNSFTPGTPILDFSSGLPYPNSPFNGPDLMLNTPAFSPVQSPVIKNLLPDKPANPVRVDMVLQTNTSPEAQENLLRETISHIFTCSETTCNIMDCRSIKMKFYHCCICTIQPTDACEVCSFIKHMFDVHMKYCTNPNCNIPLFENINYIYQKSGIKDKKYETHPIRAVVNHMPNEAKFNVVISSNDHSNHPENMATKRQSDITNENETKKIKSDISWLETDMRRKKQTPKKTHSNPAVIPAHWIKCTLCGKSRKVPNTLDPNRIPNFVCELNIWDPPFSNCSVPEETNKNNATIDLQGNYVEYEQEKEDFMEKLKQFHRDVGTGTVLRTPTLGRKEVDLYRLFREVTANGGSSSVVSKEGTWAKIYRGLENFSPTETSASFRLKKMYNKYLLPYEHQLFHFDDPRGDTKQNKGRMISNPGNNRINIPYPLPQTRMSNESYLKQNNNMKLPMINKYTYPNNSMPLPPVQNNIPPKMMSNATIQGTMIKTWGCANCGRRYNENVKICSNCNIKHDDIHPQVNNNIKPIQPAQPPIKIEQTPHIIPK